MLSYATIRRDGWFVKYRAAFREERRTRFLSGGDGASLAGGGGGAQIWRRIVRSSRGASEGSRH
jgi:hypothetical protein